MATEKYKYMHQLFPKLAFIDEKITADAKNIVKKFENIFFVYESLDHDGCDKFGFKSKLWDLYIITKENMLYYYHREDWKKDKKENYELIFKKDMIDMVNTPIFDELIFFSIRDNHNNLKKLLDNILEKLNIKK